MITISVTVVVFLAVFIALTAEEIKHQASGLTIVSKICHIINNLMWSAILTFMVTALFGMLVFGKQEVSFVKVPKHSNIYKLQYKTKLYGENTLILHTSKGDGIGYKQGTKLIKIGDEYYAKVNK